MLTTVWAQIPIINIVNLYILWWSWFCLKEKGTDEILIVLGIRFRDGKADVILAVVGFGEKRVDEILAVVGEEGVDEILARERS
jgi:hypothetical protein